MPGLGEASPLGLALGGGPSDQQKLADALRDAMGVGGSAADGTIDHAWRLAMAKGLAACSAFEERAAWQAWPGTAIDHIPVYEELLGVLPPIDASEHARRLVTEELWVREIDAATPTEAAWLAELDSRLSILSYDPGETAVTHLGRSFQPFVTTFTNNIFAYQDGRRGTAYPNYADEFVLVVFFDLGAGVAPDARDLAVMQQVRERLNEDLPGWVTFRIITEVGFILEQSLLDIGAFGPP